MDSKGDQPGPQGLLHSDDEVDVHAAPQGTRNPAQGDGKEPLAFGKGFSFNIDSIAGERR